MSINFKYSENIEPAKLGLDSLLGVNEIRLRAGDPLEIRIPVNGAPTPTIDWKVDEKSVSQSKVSLVRQFSFISKFFVYTQKLSATSLSISCPSDAHIMKTFVKLTCSFSNDQEFKLAELNF